MDLKFCGVRAQTIHDWRHSLHEFFGSGVVTNPHSVVPETDDEFDVWVFVLDAFVDLRFRLAHRLQRFDTSLPDDLVVHLFKLLVVAAMQTYPASSCCHLFFSCHAQSDARPGRGSGAMGTATGAFLAILVKFYVKKSLHASRGLIPL